jgi:hypothetical protein
VIVSLVGMSMSPLLSRLVSPETSVELSPAAAKSRRPHVWLQRVAPYVVAASVVTWILGKYPLAGIVTEMRAGHALRMLPLALVLPFVVWLPYALYDRVVLLGAVGRVPYRDVLRAKAATSVLLALGYFFGGGGYAVWIARKTGTGAARAAGSVLYVMSSDLVAVCAVAGASMWIGGPDVPRVLRTIATGIFCVQLALLLAGALPTSLRLPVVFEPWRTVPLAWGLAQIAGRAVNIAVITAFTWAGARAFGIAIPARVMGMYLPIILLVGSLPLSVAGFGAAQAAWLLLLPWASGAQILAFHTLWQLFGGAGLLLRGLPFVRTVVAEIDAGPPSTELAGPVRAST